MFDSYLTFIETITDPWALVLISFLIAGVVVVCGALSMESSKPCPLDEEEQFFDKITRYRNEI